MNTADRFNWLSAQKPCEFHLTRNGDRACNYMTAQQWIDEGPADFSDVPADEIQRMKDTNTIWCLQIYPDTPIGFHVWYAATLEGVIDAAVASGGKP